MASAHCILAAAFFLCKANHLIGDVLDGRDHAPSIIFMDEVDSIGSARSESGGGGGGDSEVQRTMLELLNQLDGFEATNKIKVGICPHAGRPAFTHACMVTTSL